MPILVLYHHFGWAIPRSAKSRVDEGRPNAFKTRFFDFPHRSETQKHPWNRFYQFRFHTTILGGLLQSVQKAGLTKVVQLRSKRVFSSFPIGAKRKNTLGIEFQEVGFIPPFLVGFCKQRKKPCWRRSSNSVQNSCFRLSPLRRNEESPLESNLPISVSYHHFCRAFASTAKSRVDEGRPIALKTHFFDFPHRCETKKHPWDRIPRGRFHTTIFGGLLQAAQKAGLTKFVQLRWKLVFSSFPIGAKRKNTLGIEFHEACFIPPFWVGFSKQRKTAGWRRSSNCVKNSFFDFRHHGETKNHPWNRIYQFRFHTTIFGGLSQASKKAGLTKDVRLRSKLVNSTFPIGANRKNTLGSNSTSSLSYHHFGRALPRSGKRRVDEKRPIALKTRFFEFPHMGETKKHPLDRIPRGRFDTTILGGLFPAAQKAGLTKVVQLRSKLVFWTFPIEVKRKNTLGIKFHEVGFIPPFWVGFSKQRETPVWRRSSNCVENSFFRLSPLGRNEETPFGSNYTRSVSYHHFWWAFPSSAKLRVDEGRPIAFKTRFVDIPHRGETKKHPWDRIPPGRFHTTILGGLYQPAENAGMTKFFQLGWKLVLSSFPIGTKQKNTLGIEFHEVGFIPTFLLGPCKQCKKAGWRRSSICLENSFFRLSPSERNEKTPLGSNSTRSVSYHHFGLVLPSRGKRRVDEGRPIAFKTRFVDIPHRGETKMHPWDRIPPGRFHTTILGGLYQPAENAGMTKFFQLGWKLVLSSFPIGTKQKNTLGIEFHEVGFIPTFLLGPCKQCKKAGWRRSSICLENSFFRLSPSERNEKTPLGSNSTRSVLYHHFGLVLPSRGKRRVDEGRPIGLKTRFFDFPHRSETKKHTWDRIPRGRFYTTILGWTYQAAEKARLTKVFQLGWKLVLSSSPIRGKQKKNPWDRIPWGRFHTTIFSGLLHSVQKAGLTKVVQLRWKLVSSSFPIGAKRKNTIGFEFHEVGFIPPFWVGFTKERKTPGWRRSSNCVENSFFRVSPYGRIEKTPFGSNSTRSVSHHHFGWAFPSNAKSRVDEGRPIAFKTRFFDFSHRGETKKHPWVRIPGGRFHTPIFAGLYQAAENAGLTKVVQLRSKLVLSSFPIGAKQKNTLVIEFHEVGFIPPFWVGFSKQRKTPVWPRSSNWVENSFCRVSPSGRNKKTPLGSNSTRSVSYHHFCWAFASSAKSRVEERRPIAFKTRFFDYPHRGKTKKHPWDRIPRGRFHTTILGWIYQVAENAGLTKVVQLRSKLFFLRFPIGAKRKNTLGIEFHEFGFKPQFWVGFCKQRKKPAV